MKTELQSNTTLKIGDEIWWRSCLGRLIHGVIRSVNKPYPENADQKYYAKFEDCETLETFFRENVCRSILFHIGSPCVFCGYKHDKQDEEH